MENCSKYALNLTPFAYLYSDLLSMGETIAEVYRAHLVQESLIKPCFISFPGGSDGKASACNAGDLGLIPGLGRSPGEGHGNPFQYSCLENSMDRAWWATVHGLQRVGHD